MRELNLGGDNVFPFERKEDESPSRKANDVSIKSPQERICSPLLKRGLCLFERVKGSGKVPLFTSNWVVFKRAIKGKGKSFLVQVDKINSSLIDFIFFYFFQKYIYAYI